MQINSSSSLSVCCEFFVPAESVFDAIINPELIRKWFVASPAVEVTEVHVDATYHGHYSILQKDINTNQIIGYSGTFREIERPRRLVFKLNAPELFSDEAEVDIQISAIEKGCRLNLEQYGSANEIMKEQWKTMLQQLKLSLEIW
jgi:uncharacterized protein YndB with AHSA1/START domain